MIFFVPLQSIRTKKTQRKYKEKTNDDNSPLRPISYLCPIYQGYIQGL
nr:MAG TPA: hypothetical protein [Caudoviricetes sp.]